MTGCGSNDGGGDNTSSTNLDYSENNTEIDKADNNTDEQQEDIELSIDPMHLEALFEVDGKQLLNSITKETYPEELNMVFDDRARLVYITEHGDEMAIYGVMTGGYVTDYIDALFDAGWLMNSNHLWSEQKEENGDWHTMMSTVFEQDDMELVLTGDITEMEEYVDEGDFLVTEVTLISCIVADEIADEAGIDSYIDYTKTSVLDINNPEIETLDQLEDGVDKYRLSDFYRLMKLEEKVHD